MSSDAITYLPRALENAADGRVIAEKDSERISGRFGKVEQCDPQACLEVTDERLLEQVSRGERDALALLFRRHARSVLNIAMRILQDGAESDDLLQDVFLFAYRKAALFDPTKGSARSWIFQVAYHRAFNRRHYLTARQHYRVLQLDEEILGPRAFGPETPNGSSSVDAILGQELLTKCKARLSPEQMRTLELFFFEGYTLKEIAELTGQSLANVRSYYYRGLERLRKFLTPDKARTK